MKTRRDFNGGLASLAFGGLALASCSKLQVLPDAIARAPGFRTAQNRRSAGLGPLRPDPAETPILDLPEGLSYKVISRRGEIMDDGFTVPDAADGMGSFDLGGDLVALVRNHELEPGDFARSAFRGAVSPAIKAYDRSNGQPLPGGTTTIVYDCRKRERVRHHLSLAGTVRNCAGGATPWGSWLTCEEASRDGLGGKENDHGWVFEVPADHPGLVDPVPLRALGRFEHEAAAVHPNRKVVYLTEDQRDGLFYRFVAKVPGRLAEGGTLQALALAGPYEGADARNWSKRKMPPGLEIPVRWIDLENVDSPGRDDLRKRGHAAGATRFANGEGIHFGFGDVFFCLTSGGAIKSGQIMRYRPSPREGEGGAMERAAPATLELFFESNDPASFNFGDNLAVAPNGHLVVCEDPYWGGQKTFLPRAIDSSAPCFLRGVTPQGSVYDIARLHGGSELAGACFSPDGRTLFVNVMSRAKTLAIWAEPGSRWGEAGPWGPPLPGWKIPRAKSAVS
jgi:hypothetical protein